MNILLLGYGKMGRAIEQIALDRGHQIVGRIDLNNRHALDLLAGKTGSVDAVIEFSTPDSVVPNLTYCLAHGWPVVCGTTGWLGNRPEVEKMCLERRGAFFYASNYSIGVNLFFRLNKTLARFMHQYPSYCVSMTEIHHTEKQDSPSGTAITLADGIIDHLPGKTRWQEQADNVVHDEDTVVIKSVREGTVPGTHTIQYESDVDRIEISHVAHSRQGFALGAVIAAEWIIGREGVFGMDDLLTM